MEGGREGGMEGGREGGMEGAQKIQKTQGALPCVHERAQAYATAHAHGSICPCLCSLKYCRHDVCAMMGECDG